jgi:methionyl aminopeptidase
MISRNDPCWCGSNKKWKKCHFPEKPQLDFNHNKELYAKSYGIILKDDDQIQKIKAACHLASSILDKLCSAAIAGVTTQMLDDMSMQLHKEAKAVPAPLGYSTPPFPKSICTSINEVICHGIPNDVPLKNGDIVNIDVTSILDGYYGDCSRMVAIGEISSDKQLVMDVSKECLSRAIAVCSPGVNISAIGEAIEEYAHSQNCSVVHQFVGHGVGVSFHEPPQIPHYNSNIEIPLTPGMTFTIEPMINAGSPDAVIDPKTQWIATTIDNKPSGQWEHTILITANGHEILTL